MPNFLGDVRQIGFMSHNIDRSMRYFVDKMGIGPWYILRHMTAPMLYHGKATEPVVSIAMANSGAVQFEIVAQHNDAASLYSDALQQADGLHIQHMAFWVDDIPTTEAELHSRGWNSIFETCAPPGKSVFVVHPEQPLVCIELSDYTPFKERVRERIAKISREWDGTDPVREGIPQ